MKRVTSENFGEVYRKMIAFFHPDLVEARPLFDPRDQNNPTSVAAFYVDARCIEDRLDMTVGPANWNSKITLTPEGAICDLSILIDGEWVTKSNVSQYTDVEATKGAASKALVRAASSWGIGRYFYDITNVWHPVVKRGRGWVFETMPPIPSEFLPK